MGLLPLGDFAPHAQDQGSPVQPQSKSNRSMKRSGSRRSSRGCAAGPSAPPRAVLPAPLLLQVLPLQVEEEQGVHGGRLPALILRFAVSPTVASSSAAAELTAVPRCSRKSRRTPPSAGDSFLRGNLALTWH